MYSIYQCCKSYLKNFAGMVGQSQVLGSCTHLCLGLAASLWVAEGVLWVWQPRLVKGVILLLASERAGPDVWSFSHPILILLTCWMMPAK